MTGASCSMAGMKRSVAILTIFAALLVVAAAYGGYREYGKTDSTPRPSCPTDCNAIGRVTGFQVQVHREGKRSIIRPYKAKVNGKLVSFSIKLGKPSSSQIRFFRRLYGRPAQARITILRPDPRNRNQNHRSTAQSETFTLDPYFGSTPHFALEKPLPVRKGYVIALTVPTWAPAFAVNRPSSDRWRSSRGNHSCSDVSRVDSHQKVGAVKSYRCLHKTARLLYTALVVSNPPRQK